MPRIRWPARSSPPATTPTPRSVLCWLPRSARGTGSAPPRRHRPTGGSRTGRRGRGRRGKPPPQSIGAVQARGLTGYVSHAGHRQPLAAYAQRVVRVSASRLAAHPVTGTIRQRRDDLTAVHVKAVTRAWKHGRGRPGRLQCRRSVPDRLPARQHGPGCHRGAAVAAGGSPGRCRRDDRRGLPRRRLDGSHSRADRCCPCRDG